VVRFLAAGASLFVASSCGPGEPTLAELAKHNVQLRVASGPLGVAVALEAHEVAYCPAVTTAVTVDGLAVPELQSGGPTRACGGFAQCAAECWRPTWQLVLSAPAADVPSSTLRVGEGADAWVMTVEHLFAARSFTQVPGSSTAFLWSPASDVPWARALDVSLPDGGLSVVAFTYDAGTVVLGTPLPPGDESVRFDIVRGAWGSTFRNGEPTPAITSCTGATTCTSETGEMSDLAVTIAP
jgi:hypothetical protein